MNQEEVLRFLHEVGAVITDSHFVYTSRRHGSVYVNKDALYTNTKSVAKVCRALAEYYRSENVQVVLGPVMGGVVLAHWVAYYLVELTGQEVSAIFAEKADDPAGRFELRRGYDKLVIDKNVLVVEDILTTGGTAKQVIELVRQKGGKVVGLATIWNRGNVSREDLANVLKLVSLVNYQFESWEEADCPLCRSGVPINVEVGKGREFLAVKR